ncbi:zinc ABC transporter substrate-binding protein ZnuA [Vibrio japonicus]|uniref:High-affinity zinc uptake system protein ZnuA n=1 Tax=Vibrio japonicus TaxID=1824638 RepID=A0ABY5LGC9_9VIBR|nr:zinc ABC transporter substrate-binding protein ZnuA [Vibrio japonicus]UUM29812.1 zinc ABC transporter substrate-binding protein ZnuA [Vibrio japonicus]
MKRIFALLISVLAVYSVQASTVLTSIKPIQFITLELTQGVSQPDVLLGSNTSPHDYALRPSDVKRIRKSDLVIWFGHDLEPFLEKVLSEQSNILTISDIPGLELHEFSSDHDDHHGHDHGNHDPHFWLGYKPTQQVARAITERLIQTDSENTTVYRDNLATFLQKLEQQQQTLKQQLSSVQDKGYYVFHDAYGYFEHDFALNNLGHFTVSPERKPGAKTLIKIRQALASEEAKCVFSEPQFTPAVVESVTRGSKAKLGVLDPLGTDVESKLGAYFMLREQLAESFASCLNPSL